MCRVLNIKNDNRIPIAVRTNEAFSRIKSTCTLSIVFQSPFNSNYYYFSFLSLSNSRNPSIRIRHTCPPMFTFSQYDYYLREISKFSSPIYTQQSSSLHVVIPHSIYEYINRIVAKFEFHQVYILYITDYRNWREIWSTISQAIYTERAV